MVVLNDGIILEEDETRAYSMLGKNTILPISSMSRAIRAAKRVAYDALSKQAVEAMLGNMREDIEYKPLMLYIGAEARLWGSRGSSKYEREFMMRHLKCTGKDMKTLALLTNRIIEVHKEAVYSGGITWTQELKSIFIEPLVGKIGVSEERQHDISNITMDMVCYISNKLKPLGIALAGINEEYVHITANSSEQLEKEADIAMAMIERIGKQIG